LDHAVYVYEVKSQEIVARVSNGSGPHWGAVSPDAKYVGVSNAGSDDLSISDAQDRQEVTRLKVGRVGKRLVAASVPPPSADLSSSR